MKVITVVQAWRLCTYSIQTSAKCSLVVNGSTSHELNEDVTRQLHVVLGKMQRSHGAVFVEAFTDELANVRVCDAGHHVMLMLLARWQRRRHTRQTDRHTTHH